MGDYGEHGVYISISRATPTYIVVGSSVLPTFFINHTLHPLIIAVRINGSNGCARDTESLGRPSRSMYGMRWIGSRGGAGCKSTFRGDTGRIDSVVCSDMRGGDR